MSLLYTYKHQKDRLLHSISMSLMAYNVTPNMLSATGFFICLIAGAIAASGRLYLSAVIFLIGACFDALDGSLARVSGLNNEYGLYFDSICDRLSELSLVLGAVVGGASPSAYVVVIGSIILMSTRIINHLKGHNSDVALFGRPERIALLLTGLVLPSPYDYGSFIAAGLLCIVSSIQVLSYTIEKTNVITNQLQKDVLIYYIVNHND